MKLVFPMICAIALSLAGSMASAQGGCAGSTNTAQISCQNPHTGCPQTTVTQTMPNFGQFGVTWLYTPVTRCSVIYPSYSPQGFSCGGDGKLADPAIRQHFLELARSEEIIVSSCKGEYRPLEVVLAANPVSRPGEQFDPLRLTHALPSLARGGE